VYVCSCKAVRVSDVERAAQSGCTTPGALIAMLELDDPMCCGRCIEEIDEIVFIALEAAERAPANFPVVSAHPERYIPRLNALH
jgi:bacterioferritin-associated ferredoxin